MTMTYFYDSSGGQVKAYDLHQMFSEDGANIPIREARDSFQSLRDTMRYGIRSVAEAVYGDNAVICYRELEDVRLDVLGFSDDYIFQAWLTKPSANHPFGRVRSDVILMPQGVRLQGNGRFVSR